jgi:hypothetical protein
VNNVGNALEFTWFTYDADGSPTWFYGEAPEIYGDYDAPLVRMSGPSYLASGFDPQAVRQAAQVGSIELEIADNNHLTMSAGGAAIPGWNRTLTRYVYRAGRTTCVN